MAYKEIEITIKTLERKKAKCESRLKSAIRASESIQKSIDSGERNQRLKRLEYDRMAKECRRNIAIIDAMLTIL